MNPGERIDNIIAELEDLKSVIGGDDVPDRPGPPLQKRIRVDWSPEDLFPWSPTVEDPTLELQWAMQNVLPRQHAAGYRIVAVTATVGIDNVVPNPELPDGIHGVIWIHDGGWKQHTLAYVTWRGERGIWAMKSLWRNDGRDKDRIATNWEAAWANYSPYSPGETILQPNWVHVHAPPNWGPIAPKTGAGMVLERVDSEVDWRYSPGYIEIPPISTDRLHFVLGNPDHRGEGGLEIPSLGWTYHKMDVTLTLERGI